MAQKQREMMAQVELAHQRELSEQLKKHDTLITEKQKGSHYHIYAEIGNEQKKQLDHCFVLKQGC